MELAYKVKGKLNDLLMKSPKLANGLKKASDMVTGFMHNLLFDQAIRYELNNQVNLVD